MVYAGNSWLEGTLLLNIPVIAIAYVQGGGEHLVPLHPPATWSSVMVAQR